MEKKTTLSDFIKNYLENLEIKYKKESYGDWLKSSGINSLSIHKDSISDAEADYKRASATFGSNAERLSQNGLTQSGYSDYLTSRAYAALQERKSKADREYAENERKNLSGYGKYVSALESEKSKETKDYLGYLISLEKGGGNSYMNAVSDIEKKGIIDYDTAYAVALKSGLSEEEASSAANLSTSIVRRALKNKIIDYAIKSNMDDDDVYTYAMGLGLPAEDAEEIAFYIDELSSFEFSSGVDIGQLK